MLSTNCKIFVTGHRGLVGSAILRTLEGQGYRNILTAAHTELDLTNQTAVNQFMDANRPDVIFAAAGRVGGILANAQEPAQFIYENTLIASNLIHSAYKNNVKKLLYLGSSCIYPKRAEQPIQEDALLSGSLEPTNQWYAIAKIAGIKMCQAYRQQYGCDFIAAMPTNLYGPGDHYDPERSHVLPALIHKFSEAKRLRLPDVECWGSGRPRREFLYVDDLAEACLKLMECYSADEIVNIGYGSDVSIHELTTMVQEVVGYKGQIAWDRSKPDGTFRKLLDSRKMKDLGWKPKIGLREGMARAFADYQRRNPNALETSSKALASTSLV